MQTRRAREAWRARRARSAAEGAERRGGRGGPSARARRARRVRESRRARRVRRARSARSARRARRAQRVRRARRGVHVCTPLPIRCHVPIRAPPPTRPSTSMHGPRLPMPRPSPSKMFRTPPLTVLSPRPPVNILSVRPSFFDRTPSALKPSSELVFSGRIQDNKEHAQNRRQASKARGGVPPLKSSTATLHGGGG